MINLVVRKPFMSSYFLFLVHRTSVTVFFFLLFKSTSGVTNSLKMGNFSYRLFHFLRILNDLACQNISMCTIPPNLTSNLLSGYIQRLNHDPRGPREKTEFQEF